MKTKTILIAKTERLLCDVLSLLCTSFGFKVLDTTTDGLQALHLIEQKRPDILIIDATLPPLDGFEILQRVQRCNPRMQTILYIGQQHAEHVREAIRLQVDSFLFAEDSIDELAKCLMGAASLDQLKKEHLKRRLQDLSGQKKGDRLNLLTPMQLKILSLVGTHKTMPEIAEELFISPHTVNNHIANIRKKLNIQGRGKILKYALDIKDRLIEIDGKIQVASTGYSFP